MADVLASLTLEQSPDEFFSLLSARALQRAKAAPRLVGVTPIADRGWVLDHELQRVYRTCSGGW